MKIKPKHILILTSLVLVITLNISVVNGWYNESWNYRTNITIDHTKIENNLTDYPILVRLNSSRVDYTRINDDGSDLRFLNLNNNIEYSYEIELYNESGDSIIWVKIPEINSEADNLIYMYYGYENASDSQDIENVWSNNYISVYHFNNSYADSLDNNSLTNSGASIIVGEIGYGADLDLNEYLENTSAIGLNNANNNQSTYAYMKFNSDTSGAGDHPHIVSLDTSSNFCYAPIAENQDNFTIRQGGQPDLYTSFDINYPTNYLSIFSLSDGTDLSMSIDENIYVFNNPGKCTNAISQLTIGADSRHRTNEMGDFTIDELRLSSVNRSDSWINATYYFVNDEILDFSISESNITTTTTTPTTTTTTVTPLNITVELIESEFCSSDGSLLITNTTEYNGTLYLSSYNSTVCEYNCSETIFGTRCNYSPFINFVILIGAFILFMGIFWLIYKIISGVL